MEKERPDEMEMAEKEAQRREEKEKVEKAEIQVKIRANSCFCRRCLRINA